MYNGRYSVLPYRTISVGHTALHSYVSPHPVRLSDHAAVTISGSSPRATEVDDPHAAQKHRRDKIRGHNRQPLCGVVFLLHLEGQANVWFWATAELAASAGRPLMDDLRLAYAE